MRPERPQLALSLEGDCLRAVVAVRREQALRVVACIEATIPADTREGNADAVGRWVGTQLAQLRVDRLSNAHVVFGVPRGEVVLKRLVMPQGSLDHELPSMVRLQLARVLTVPADLASIDFVRLPAIPRISGTGPGASGGEAPAEIPVLAAALTLERLDWIRSVCRAAALRLGRAGLLSAGAAALIAEEATRLSGGTLAVIPGRTSAEYIVVSDGHLAFARSVEFARSPSTPANGEAEADADAQRIAVEAKRTWMSFRASADAAPVESAMVVGAGEAAEALAMRCAAALDLPCRTTGLPSQVRIAEGIAPGTLAAASPLIGLLLEHQLSGGPATSRPTLDFAHPRRAPDRAAARRRKVLLGSLAAIVVLGGAWTYTRIDLAERRAHVDRLRQRFDGQAGDLTELVRAEARRDHLLAWTRARADWLAELGEVLRQPLDQGVVLDALIARSEPELSYAPKAGTTGYSPQAWRSGIRASLTVSGTGAREVLDSWRARLVADPLFTLQPRGPEVPGRIDWTVTVDRDLSVAARSGPASPSDRKDGGR